MKDAPICTSTSNNINVASVLFFIPHPSHNFHLSLPLSPLWGAFLCFFLWWIFFSLFCSELVLFPALSLSLCGDCFPLTLGKDSLLHAPRSYHISYPPRRSSTEAVDVTVTWCNLVLRFHLFLSYGWQLKRWIVWGEYACSLLFNWILFMLRFYKMWLWLLACLGKGIVYLHIFQLHCKSHQCNNVCEMGGE